MSSPSHDSVACVCDNEVRIYGGVEKDRKGQEYRPFIRRIEFNNHGQARLYAQEHDERRKK